MLGRPQATAYLAEALAAALGNPTLFVPRPCSQLRSEGGRNYSGPALRRQGTYLTAGFGLEDSDGLAALASGVLPLAAVSPLCSRESDSHGGVTALSAPSLRHFH